jgi:hypothetical protein
MGLHCYQVGKPLVEGITEFATGAMFVYDESGAKLVLFMEHPTQAEMDAMQEGKLEFGLYTCEDVIVFLCRMGELSWIDAPYSAHLVAGGFEMDTAPAEWQGYGLSMFVVDSSTGLIQSMRLVALPHDYSIALRDSILAQQAMAYDAVQYDAHVTELFGKYSSDELAAMAQVREKQ